LPNEIERRAALISAPKILNEFADLAIRPCVRTLVTRNFELLAREHRAQIEDCGGQPEGRVAESAGHVCLPARFILGEERTRAANGRNAGAGITQPPRAERFPKSTAR